MSKGIDFLAAQLKDQDIHWLQANKEADAHSDTALPTIVALDRAELLWGATDLTDMFRSLLGKRGLSLYDRTLEHHFTGSSIVLNSQTRKLLMTFHPRYQIWQQLGGHDEGEHDPVAVSAREAWEESGIEHLWVCDWPVRIDPHASKCRSVKGASNNYHYDICYMAVTADTNFNMTSESVDMQWFSIAAIKQLVNEGKAQQRALEMAENSLDLFDACKKLGRLAVNSEDF
jgi:hypothetical protein